MSKIPTAEEFLQQRDCIRNVEDFYNDVQPVDLIEFAKLHVEAALEAAAENHVKLSATKDTIRNSYPEDLIK